LPPSPASFEPAGDYLPTGGDRYARAVADLDRACGDGVSYSVYFGATLLVGVTIANGAGTDLGAMMQTIKTGQSFLFLVDPGPAHNAGCDTTQLQITIDHVTT
jgi:hypothetical protein